MVLVQRSLCWLDAVVLKLFVTADPFHCTQNRCGPLHFVKVFSITEKLDFVTSDGEHLSRPDKKQSSGFGFSPTAITKIKQKKVS